MIYRGQECSNSCSVCGPKAGIKSFYIVSHTKYVLLFTFFSLASLQPSFPYHFIYVYNSPGVVTKFLFDCTAPSPALYNGTPTFIHPIFFRMVNQSRGECTDYLLQRNKLQYTKLIWIQAHISFIQQICSSHLFRCEISDIKWWISGKKAMNAYDSSIIILLF